MATLPTINKNLVRDRDRAGIRDRRVVQITGPASYTTGGFLLNAGDFNLGTLECVGGGGFLISDGTTVRLCWWDRANGKVKAFVPNTNVEVANAVNLSAFTAMIEVSGK